MGRVKVTQVQSQCALRLADGPGVADAAGGEDVGDAGEGGGGGGHRRHRPGQEDLRVSRGQSVRMFLVGRLSTSPGTDAGISRTSGKASFGSRPMPPRPSLTSAAAPALPTLDSAMVLWC